MIGAEPACLWAVHDRLNVGGTDRDGEHDELGSDLVPDTLISVCDGGFYGGINPMTGQKMIKRANPRPIKAKTLVEQKNDFTAEGAPPPGRVEAPQPPAQTPPVVPKRKGATSGKR